MSKTTETREFQAEVKQLLDLMIHSLYSNKEVFLRELISNSSDALDKIRFEALTNKDFEPKEALAIDIAADTDARTLTVSDNGIGMSKDEVLANIGTIAKSGTEDFLRTMRERKEKQGDDQIPPELIGQFGVGFYASFMVADRITLLTRRAGEEVSTLWESSGDGTFTVDEGDREVAGTTITLHLREADHEDGLDDFADENTIKTVVKKYSDFVSYPIHLEGGDGPLNSMKAIWTRTKSEVTEDEYNEFYKHVSHDWNDPLLHVSVHIEGAFEARALLYIPGKAPFDLFHREMAHRGIHLYVKRIFIMDDCEELIPIYLRFVRGVVDSEDLSLNVSREILQQDRQIQAIRKRLVKKVLDVLSDLQKEDGEKYLTFWGEFGQVIKEGFLDFSADREKLLNLILCSSTHDSSQLFPLSDYVGRMKEGQESIYFLCGESKAAVESSPHLEAFRAKGFEVLFFHERVDEIWLDNPSLEFDGKKLVSVGRGEVELGTEDEQEKAKEDLESKNTEFKGLLDRLRSILQDEIKDARLSGRLTDSPSCLVNDEGEMSPQLEAIMRQSGQDVPKVKRILEINPNHVLMTKLQGLVENDKAAQELTDAAWLLYGQAVLAEGGKLDDPAAFGKRVADLMAKSM